jgi:uncharacterized protein (DUF2141 family)/Flp pilus assembly protein TadD
MLKRQTIQIGLLQWRAILLSFAVLFCGVATADQTIDVSKQGWLTFLEVLAGDQARLQAALRQLEEAVSTAPENEYALFNLGRAYFYDAITYQNLASAEKAERAFARVLKLNPKHDALAFHGSVLAILGQGRDLEMLSKGVQEMNRAVQENPNSLNGRFSRSLTALGLAPQARSAMGKYDPAEDLEFANRAFQGIESHFAPHAEVGSEAFLGEAYLLNGDVAKARASFKAALAVSPPADPEAKAGRILLQQLIQTRLDGSEQSLPALLGQSGLGTCNLCHLRISHGVSSSLKSGAASGMPINARLNLKGTQTVPTGDLKVEIVGLKSTEGQLRVALFDSEAAFLKNPVSASVVSIEQSQGHWQANSLRCGFYALAVYHDRNGDGKLNSNMLGIPLEPYGFSNNARGILGPPSFQDARFQVASPQTRIVVSLE